MPRSELIKWWQGGDMLHKRQPIAILVALTLAAAITGCGGFGGAAEWPDTGAGRPGVSGDLDGTEWVPISLDGSIDQEQRYLDSPGDVVAHRIYGGQLWLETGDGSALVLTAADVSEP
jgi:hypothetical protein